MGLDQGWTLRGALCPFPDAIPSLPHTPVILCPGLSLTAPSPPSGQTPSQHPQVNIDTLSEDSDEERPPPTPPGRREALQLQPYCIPGSPTPPPPQSSWSLTAHGLLRAGAGMARGARALWDARVAIRGFSVPAPLLPSPRRPRRPQGWELPRGVRPRLRAEGKRLEIELSCATLPASTCGFHAGVVAGQRPGSSAGALCPCRPEQGNSVSTPPFPLTICKVR